MNGMQEPAPAGLGERLLREIIATPALKEIILLQMKDIKAETAPGLVKTLLWGDPGISMSLFGALPDMLNWLLELLLEVGRQLNGLPEPLLKDILGQVGGGIDGERLKQLPEVYGRLAKRLAIGEDAAPEEVRAAVVDAVNGILGRLEAFAAGLEERRDEVARNLAAIWKELDTAALARSLRHLGAVAAAAARPGGAKKRPGAARKVLPLAGAAAALLVVRAAVKRVRG